MVNKPKQQRPVVGASTDLWGDVLNQNMDLMDNFSSAVVDELGTHSQELARLEQDKINIADLDTIVADRVDNYTETDAKPQLDAYINDEKKPELDAYTVQKKSDINNYVETVSKVSINDFTEVQKTELNTHELLKESELDAHELLKESELDSHTLAKQTQLDTYEDSKEAELEVFTVTKKAEINTYKDSMNSEINLFTEANKIEITEHTDNKKVELDSHEKVKEGQLDAYTTSKEGQVESFTTVKKEEIQDFTDEKKVELNTHTDERKVDLDSYERIKEGELDSHTVAKQNQLDTYEESKEAELETFTIAKKAEMNTYKDSMNAEVNTFAEGKKVEITQHTESKKAELDTYEDSKEAELDAFTIVKEGQIDAYTFSKKGEIDTKTEEEKIELDAYNEVKKGQLDTHEASKEAQLDIYADGREAEMVVKADTEIARINATGLDGKLDIITYNTDKVIVETNLNAKLDKTVYNSDKAIMEGNINSKLDATAFDSYSVIAGKGTAGGGKLSVNPVIDVVALDDSMVIENDGIKVNTVDDLVTGGIKRPLSAEQGKVLKQLIDAVGDGGVGGLVRSSESLTEYDYTGTLPANGTSIAVGKKLFDPTLYLDGVRIEATLYSVDLTTGLIVLVEPYSVNYATVWVVEDRMPFHITFCFPTLALLLASEDMKSRIILGDVIKILGESEADDGGAYLIKCEDTAKLNAVDIGEGRFLNEIPNTKISTLKSEVEQNKMDILLKLDKSGGDVTGIVNFKSNPKILNEYPVMDYIHTNGTTSSLGNFDGDGILKVLSGNQRGEILTTGNCPISKSANGWCKFANGLIVQWGSSNGTVDVAFPISFSYPPQVITSGFVVYASPIYQTLSGCEAARTNNFKLVTYGYMALGELGSDINNASFLYTTGTVDFKGPTRWIAIGW